MHKLGATTGKTLFSDPALPHVPNFFDKDIVIMDNPNLINITDTYFPALLELGGSAYLENNPNVDMILLNWENLPGNLIIRVSQPFSFISYRN